MATFGALFGLLVRITVHRKFFYQFVEIRGLS